MLKKNFKFVITFSLLILTGTGTVQGLLPTPPVTGPPPPVIVSSIGKPF